MLFAVVMLFAICWLPYQIYQTVQSVFQVVNSYEYINIIFFCSHWLAMSNSGCNPFIYLIFNERFKKEFLTKFRYCRDIKRRRSDGVNGEMFVSYSARGRSVYSQKKDWKTDSSRPTQTYFL